MNDTLFRERRSIRRFKQAHPGREAIRKLVEIATLAPSASNKQPWRFFAVDDPQLIAAMADVVSAANRRIEARIAPRFAAIFEKYGDYFVRFRDAPVVLSVLYKPLQTLSMLVEGDPADDLGRQIASLEQISGLVSASLALQNLLLYAPVLGLGCSCMTGPLVAADELRQLLSVPPSWRLAALIPVGYPDETPLAPPRKSVDAVLRWVEMASEEGDDDDGTG